MIDLNVEMVLPDPWNNATFCLDQVRPVNYLVGPNGSGKSRFAAALGAKLPKSRLLPTDRLTGMEQHWSFPQFSSQQFEQGLARSRFSGLTAPVSAGSGIAALAMLEERLNVRIQVEATLRHLFNREIYFDWDEGNLVPKARRRGTGNSLYRLDRDECHGIKELCVLLANLYDETVDYLLVDEPELNLHPQLQAFLVQEIHKVAGDPRDDVRKKVFFLITHSPFVLTFRSHEDLRSVISFSLDYEVPKRPEVRFGLDSAPASFVHRLNSHQKQLFFSDDPIFVEGPSDAQIVTAMMSAMGVSIAGAGSCVIEAGGADEINQYLNLCGQLGKTAHFMYDLDSLFTGNLRSCINNDSLVRSYLSYTGMGNDFKTYCRQLDQQLDLLVERIVVITLPESLDDLGNYLNRVKGPGKWDRAKRGKARTAVMFAASKYRDDLVTVLGLEEIETLEGRRNQIVQALAQRNIHLLAGGSLERYLPSYSGDEYQLTEAAKKQAVQAELEWLVSPVGEAELLTRYGDLFSAIRLLPSEPEVDTEPVIRKYLRDYVHRLQGIASDYPAWQHDDVETTLKAELPEMANVFSLRCFQRSGASEFQATVVIAEMLGQPAGIVRVDNKTVAGTGAFTIELV
jgi:hypothetical protein